MKVLHLTTFVRDVRTTGTMSTQPFSRSPVTIGRRDSNSLRLDASSVSRHHGAFLFSTGRFQYIDLHSANGSFIDGVRVQPDEAIDIRDSSVIRVGPYQIIARLDLAPVAIAAISHDG